MSRNGSGVYSLPGTYLAVSGETIEAQQHNDPLEDLEADANAARPVVAGGTGAATAADARTNLSVMSSAEVAAAIAALIPAGTAMLFQQTAAPTGWTKQTTHNNKALRLVSGTAGSGGSTAFTSVFAARTIAQGNLPNVNFTVSGITLTNGTISSGVGAFSFYTNISGSPAGGTSSFVMSGTNSASVGATTSNVSVASQGTAASGGSGTAMDFAVQYVDVIIATKDA